MKIETKSFLQGFFLGASAMFLSLAILAGLDFFGGPNSRAYVPIIVAARDIQEGDTITPQHLRTIHIFKETSSSHMMRPNEEKRCVGRVAGLDIGLGSPIFRGTLKEPAASSPEKVSAEE